MALEIPKNDKLSPEEAAVEARFSAEVRSDTDAFVRRYHENFCRDGIWIDTDRARESWQTFFGLVEEFSRYGERFTVGVRVNSLAGDDPDVPLARFAGMPGGTVEEMRAAHALFRAESGGLESSHPAIYEAFLQAGSRQ